MEGSGKESFLPREVAEAITFLRGRDAIQFLAFRVPENRHLKYGRASASIPRAGGALRDEQSATANRIEAAHRKQKGGRERGFSCKKLTRSLAFFGGAQDRHFRRNFFLAVF